LSSICRKLAPRREKMKPIHVVAAVGGLAIAGVLAWFFYMQANPPYETTDVRGLGEGAPAAPATAATPEAPATAAPATEAPAP
jgi:hypothetical protein